MTGIAPYSNAETDDAYRNVVAFLNDRWRVILCRDGIQWVLQYAKQSRHRTAWRGRSYCRSREGLLRACARHAGEITPGSRAILDRLPARVPDGAC